MLKGIPAFIDAELLWVLAAMGHGDELVIVDRNFPARAVAKATPSGKLITLGGMDAPATVAGLLPLFPLDDFVDAPLAWMDPCPTPGAILPASAEILALCRKAEGRDIGHAAIERMAFYERARACFAVVRTSESRPYANFILTKGVVRD